MCIRFKKKQPRSYSGAAVRIPSLCRRQPGGVEPHQRGEGLRHPVGDHRHGAEHDADLQQRYRHLWARVILSPDYFSLFPFFLLNLMRPDSSRLHSTDSGVKRGGRVLQLQLVPTAASCFTRRSGSGSALFLDISDLRYRRRTRQKRPEQRTRFEVGKSSR